MEINCKFHHTLWPQMSRDLAVSLSAHVSNPMGYFLFRSNVGCKVKLLGHIVRCHVPANPGPTTGRAHLQIYKHLCVHVQCLGLAKFRMPCIRGWEVAMEMGCVCSI